jgi:eukaryotic-like serine/threonine-protein kinase
MSFRDRIEWLFRMALMLFILTSVAFLSAIIAIRFSIQGRQVPMPDVVGKKASDAQLILRGRDLSMTIEDRIYNSLPVDEVVRQSPPPNIRVKIGQYAHVVLSLGPQKVSIPPVEGSSVRMARIELLRGGMQIGEISSAYLSGWPADSVIQQDPREGTTDVTSPHENVLVSLGSRPVAYPMPDLAGVPLGDAESRLNAAGLKVAKLNLVPGTTSPHGVVIGETPARGSRVDASSSIELNVAE